MEDASVVRRSEREERGMCGPPIEWIAIQPQRKSIRIGTKSRAVPIFARLRDPREPFPRNPTNRQREDADRLGAILRRGIAERRFYGWMMWLRIA